MKAWCHKVGIVVRLPNSIALDLDRLVLYAENVLN